MTPAEESGDIIDRLRGLQANDGLPEDVRKTTRALIARLTSPARITLLGPAGAGKSTLRDVLAAAPVLPNGQRLPTTELRYGDSESITATLPDRSVRTFEGLDLAAATALSPVFLELQAPLEALKSFGILELVTDGTAREFGAAIRWAAPRTDIALWVTTEYDAAEQAIWARAPDAMKDHGFLVLNKVDQMPPAERDARCAALRDLSEPSFRAFFPVSATAALTQDAKDAGAEGCRALVKSLRRHVDLANQADIDGALMILNRFAPSKRTERPSSRPRSQPVSRPEKRPASQPVSRPSSKPVDAKVDTVKPSSGRTSLQLDQLAARPGQDTGAKGAVNGGEALERLRICAADLLADWTFLGDPSPETVLDRCAETVEQIAEAMTPDDRLHDPVHEANDLIVLLQLERSPAAATSAVTALLQIKREMELAVAA